MNPTMLDKQIVSYLNNAGFKNPTPLQNRVFPVFLQKKDIIAGVNGAKGKRTSFIVPLLISLDSHRDQIRSIIIVADPENVKKASKEFKKYASKNNSDIIIAELISDILIKQELKVLSSRPDIIIGTPSRIIDHIRRENISLSSIETAVVDTPVNMEDNGFFQDLDFIFSKMPEKHQKIFYIENENSIHFIEPLVKKPVIIAMDNESTQEKPIMKTKETVDAVEIEKNINDFLKRIKEEEDPDLLNSYRKLFKKYTPFAMRGYLSAYLLMKAASQGRSSHSRRRPVPDENKTTLFISVGKNRRVYPKDLARLFQSRLDLDQSDIGSIKVLDSYSFLEISKNHAKRAIELLNGEEFKGRNLTVNHARKRNGEQ